jgi:hypothetical protein
MRFMIIRKADSETEAGVLPSEALVTAMLAYNDEMIKAGVMIDGAGLQKSDKGARISFRNGAATITDGPFAETKELVAGFTIIDVKSKAEALEWVKRWPPLDGHGNVQLELRQLFSAEDFGDQAVEQAKKFEQSRAK